jgi:hypothetical protein
MATPWKSKGGRRQLIGILLAIGATPTITFRVEVSVDGTNWATTTMVKDGAAGAQANIITDTETTAAVFMFMLTNGWFPYIRLNVTANTNITVTNAWLTEDGIVTPATLAETTITGNTADQ